MALSPEWLKLPKRHCDNCGALYKQVRPRREGEHGFCKANCRKQFHKHQGAYSKLHGEMKKMVEKAIKNAVAELRKELYAIVYLQVKESLERQIEQAAALHKTREEILEGLTKGPSLSPAAQRERNR